MDWTGSMKLIIFLVDYAKFLLVTAIIWLCYSNLKRFYDWNEARKIINKLPGPQTIPILGNINMFFAKENIFQVCSNIIEQFKDATMPIRIWIGHQPLLLITRVEDAHILLHSSKSMEKEERYRYLREFIGQGLLTSHVDVWARHRKVMNPMFNQKLLESFVPKFNKYSKELVDSIHKEIGNNMFDTTYYIAACVLDFACVGLMGTTTDAQRKVTETKRFVDSVVNIMGITQTRMNNLWLQPDLLFKLSEQSKIQLKNHETVRSWIDKVISRKSKQHFQMSSPDKLKTTPMSLLGQFLDLTQTDSEDKWTESEMINEVDTLFITAVDTSGTTVALTLMMLGIYPHVQDKLYNEIHGIFGDSDRDIAADDIKKMVYMERVIKETLRFFPIGPFIGRMTTGTVQFENCKVPANTGCLLALRDIQMNPKYWGKDSDIFDPDRFSPERSQDRHPGAFLAFSVGPRNCIGTKYAYIVMKVILTSILRNYKVYCDMKLKDIELNISIALKIKGGYRITIEERKNASIFPINQDNLLLNI